MMHQLAKIVLSAGVLLILSGCGGSTVSTGPEVVAGPVSVGVRVNNRGEVVLETSVTVPLVSAGIVGVNWVTSYEAVLNDAEQSSNHIYIIYTDANGNYHSDEYDVGQAFNLKFSDDEHVGEIFQERNGNMIVRVDVQGGETYRSDVQSVNSPGSNTNAPDPAGKPYCPGASWSPRVEIGDTVTVCTIERLRVRDRVDGEILFLLLPMEEGTTRLEILDGPFCGEDSWWWKVRIPANSMSNGPNTYAGAPIVYTTTSSTGYVREGLDRERLPDSQGYFLCP